MWKVAKGTRPWLRVWGSNVFCGVQDIRQTCPTLDELRESCRLPAVLNTHQALGVWFAVRSVALLL